MLCNDANFIAGRARVIASDKRLGQILCLDLVNARDFWRVQQIIHTCAEDLTGMQQNPRTPHVLFNRR